jgi:hypothetical protein
LLAIAAAAVLFRLVRLGELSLAGDEETTALATLALLDGWPPELPGGLVYLRALPFTLLEAVAVSIGGMNEFSVRLVPALLAAPRVLAAGWLARPFLGGPAALGVAGLLAVAPLDVEMSRDARMYSLFGTLDVLFLALLVRLIITGRGTLWAASTGALSVFIHALGVLHAPLPVLASLTPGVRARRALALFGVAGGVVAAFVLELQLMEIADAGSPRLQQETVGAASLSPVGNHIDSIRAVVQVPVATGVVGFAALMAAGLTLAGLSRLSRPTGRLAGAVTGVAWLAASPVLGAAGLLATLIVEGLSLRELMGRARWLLAGGLVATGGWAAAALSAHAGSVEAAARLLLGFPAPNWLEFGLAAPALSVLALAGILLAVERAARSDHPGAWLLLIGAALAPAILGGVAHRNEALRYQYHALVPVLVLALLAATTLTARIVPHRGAALLLALAITTLAVRPDQALRAVLREHGPVDEPFAVLNVAPDHRGAGVFVRAQLEPDDWVAAEDMLQQRIYTGRVDLWLRSPVDAIRFLSPDPAGGPPRDRYVGARHVGDLAALQRYAAAQGRSVVWVVTSGEVEGAPEFYRTEETDRALAAWRPLAWFVGADGLTRVYRLEEGEPVAPPRSAQ